MSQISENYYRTQDLNLAVFLRYKGIDLCGIEIAPEDSKKGLFVMRIDSASKELSDLLELWENSRDGKVMKSAFFHRKKLVNSLSSLLRR